MVPMCKKLTETSMLTDAEKEWINKYHEEVFEKTKGFFDEDGLAMKYLRRETAPI
jgi:Xaa-Pro aminopeptidase